MNNAHNPTPPGPDEPPPPYVESTTPLHSNEIPLPSSPITNASSTDFPSTHLEPQQAPQYQRPAQYRQSYAASPIQHPQTSNPPHQPVDQASSSQQSSAQYFESRPPTSRQPFSRSLHIRPNSIRADFPYPRGWAPNYNVPLQDWVTFIGFLIPDDAVDPDAKRLSPERKAAVERVIGEWNDGFFRPRGVHIVLDETGQLGTGDGLADTPHTASSDGGPSSSSSSAQAGYAASGPVPHAPGANSSSGYRAKQSSKGRLFGKLKAKASENDVSLDPQGIRVGNKFSLSAGGLKIGKFKMDQQGIEYGGRPVATTVPSSSAFGRGSPHSGYPGAGHGPRGHGGRGPGFAGWTGRGSVPPTTGYQPAEMHGHGRFAPAVGLSTPSPGYGAPPSSSGHPGGPPSPGGMGGYYMPPAGPPPNTPPAAHAEQQTGTLPASQP